MSFFLQPSVELAFFALVFSIIVFAANKTLGQRDKVKAMQKETQAYQKEMQKAIMDKDEKKLEELKKKEKDFNEKTMQMLMLPFRASLITLPVFFFFIGFFLPMFYKGFVILLPFDIHLHSLLSWTFYSNIFGTAAYGITGFFIVCSLVFGIIFEQVGSKFWPAKTPQA